MRAKKMQFFNGVIIFLDVCEETFCSVFSIFLVRASNKAFSTEFEILQ